MITKDIGSKLREKRRELNLGLEEVVEKTKLSPSAIKAIEDGDFQKLNSTYARGFIRIYAAFLNVDLSEYDIEDVHKKVELGASLKKVSQPKEVEKPATFKPTTPNVSLNKTKPQAKIQVPDPVKKALASIVVGVVAIFLLLALGRFIKNKMDDIRVAKIEKELAQKLQERDPFDKPVGLTLNKSDTQKNKQNSNAKAAVEQNTVIVDKPQRTVKEVRVAVTAKRSCGVRARVDGKILFDGILRKGSVENWKGTKEIELQIRDGSSVYVEVNGKPLPSLTKMRRPIKSLKITPSGIVVKK